MGKRIYYRDFVTRKRHWTAGQFLYWTRGGIMNAWGIVVLRKASVLFIPHYLVEKESLEWLPGIPEEEA